MTKLDLEKVGKCVIWSSDETLDEALNRNKELYVQGYINLDDLEFRITSIFTQHHYYGKPSWTTVYGQ